jgi:uncharacterized damage-inducible protein DinB
MFTDVSKLIPVYEQECANTLKLLEGLTDESLGKPQAENIRTLGRVAWHIVTTYPEMGGLIGISIDKPGEKDPIPEKASDIADAYRSATDTMLRTLKTWSNDDLLKEDNLYGETWARGKSLWVFLIHEIHHRAQMTVLMRLAGLPVPGLYGPSKEEWIAYGKEPPQV